MPTSIACNASNIKSAQHGNPQNVIARKVNTTEDAHAPRILNVHGCHCAKVSGVKKEDLIVRFCHWIGRGSVVFHAAASGHAASIALCASINKTRFSGYASIQETLSAIDAYNALLSAFCANTSAKRNAA